MSTWIHIEANHASDKVGTDRFLPGLLWSTQSNLNLYLVTGRQADQVLGVTHPGAHVLLGGLELLIVQVASTTAGSVPLARDYLVARVFKFLDLDGLAAEHYFSNIKRLQKIKTVDVNLNLPVKVNSGKISVLV